MYHIIVVIGCVYLLLCACIVVEWMWKSEFAWREGVPRLATPSVEGLGRVGNPTLYPPSKVVTIHQARLSVQRSLDKLPAAIARGVAAGHCTNPRYCQAGTCEQCACADE